MSIMLRKGKALSNILLCGKRKVLEGLSAYSNASDSASVATEQNPENLFNEQHRELQSSLGKVCIQHIKVAW